MMKLKQYITSMLLCLTLSGALGLLAACSSDPIAPSTEGVGLHIVILIPSYMVGDEANGSDIIRTIFQKEKEHTNNRYTILSEDVYPEEMSDEEMDIDYTQYYTYNDKSPVDSAYALTIETMLDMQKIDPNTRVMLIGTAAGRMVENYYQKKYPNGEGLSPAKQDSIRNSVVVLNSDPIDAPVSTTYISLYAISYLSGTLSTLFSNKVAATVPYIGNSESDSGLTGFFHGFIREKDGVDMDIATADGSLDMNIPYWKKKLVSPNDTAASMNCAISILGTNERGYNRPEEAYLDCYELKGDGYNFFYPLAGLVNHSIYLLGRRYPSEVRLVGVDRNMTNLSEDVVFCTNNETERIVSEIIDNWNAHKPLNLKPVYTMEDGYVRFEYVDRYADSYSAMINYYMSTAIEREKAYVNARSNGVVTYKGKANNN